MGGDEDETSVTSLHDRAFDPPAEDEQDEEQAADETTGQSADFCLLTQLPSCVWVEEEGTS